MLRWKNIAQDVDVIGGVSGSVYWSAILAKPSNLLSSSAQIASDISGAFAGGTPVQWSSVFNKPDGLVSGSRQVNFIQITNKPTLVSGSSQITFSGITGKPTLVSGSSQITFSGITGKPTLVSGSSQITFSGITGKPANILSSSAQIAANISGSHPVTASYALFAKSASWAPGGSSTWSSITGKPSGLVSGSTIPTASYIRKYSSVVGLSTQILNINVASRYFYTGSISTTWTLPLIADSNNVEFWIKNRGSGSINLVASGTNKIYDLTVVPSMSIFTGEAYVVYNDGMYWSVF